jgi:hypothetical protein
LFAQRADAWHGTMAAAREALPPAEDPEDARLAEAFREPDAAG